MDSETHGKLLELVRSRGIASLGTIQGGWPLVSMVLYAPATDLTALYIHVSHLAQHTSALLAEPRVGLMISERDQPTTNPLSMARVSIQGIAESLAVDSVEYAAGRAAYLQAHPKAEFNFSLGGFHLVRIRPISARFVAGFGKIVDLDAEGWMGLGKG